MDGKESFGQWLKRERKRRRLTQQQLGGIVSYSADTIRKIESDVRRFGDAQARALAEAFGVSGHETEAFVAWARGGAIPSELTFCPPDSLTRDAEDKPKMDAPEDAPLPVHAVSPQRQRGRTGQSLLWRVLTVGVLLLLLLGAVGRIAYAKGAATATHANPGGRWLNPGPSFVLRGDTAHFAARVYPSHAGDPPIASVHFTVTWGVPDGDWQLACQVTTPTPGTTDRYECDWPLAIAGVPNGPMKVSFDVYDAKGNVNYAPNGIHAGELQR